MNLIADLQKLLLAEDEFLDAKTLLDVTKITVKEKKLLEEWEEKGYLKIANVGNRQLYGLADGGKRLLQKNNPEKWLQLQQEKMRRDNEKYRALLGLIQKKAGKSGLTAVEQKQFARYLDLALTNQWLKKVEDDKYRLSESGEAKLFSLQPLADLVAGLEAFSKNVEEEINAPTQVYNQFVQSFVREQPQLKDVLQAHLARLSEHLRESLNELSAIQHHVENLDVAQQSKQILSQQIQLCKDSFGKEVERIEAQVLQEQTQWKEMQKSYIQQAQQQLLAEYQRLWQKLDRFEKLYEQVVGFLKA
jgi:hypothetical protein